MLSNVQHSKTASNELFLVLQLERQRVYLLAQAEAEGYRKFRVKRRPEIDRLALLVDSGSRITRAD